MAELRSYDADAIEQAVSMRAAIDALRRCFAGGPDHVARSAHPAGGGELLVMPAVDRGAAGVKLLMVQPANAGRGEPVIQGTYVLFDTTHGRPIALLDGAALTRLRTPAASAVATDALAPTDAVTVGIIGSGPQAIAHLEAMLCVRPGLERVLIASRTRANAEALVERIGGVPEGLGGGRPPAVAVVSIAEAAACDIVCVSTRATEPVVDASMIRPGAHVNAVGAYRADMCELAADLLQVATVTVDELAAARHEAGDLIQAADDGSWSWTRVAGDLADLASGRVGRSAEPEITVFKSVGLAIEDLVIARLVAEADGLLDR